MLEDAEASAWRTAAGAVLWEGIRISRRYCRSASAWVSWCTSGSSSARSPRKRKSGMDNLRGNAGDPALWGAYVGQPDCKPGEEAGQARRPVAPAEARARG